MGPPNSIPCAAGIGGQGSCTSALCVGREDSKSKHNQT